MSYALNRITVIVQSSNLPHFVDDQQPALPSKRPPGCQGRRGNFGNGHSANTATREQNKLFDLALSFEPQQIDGS